MKPANRIEIAPNIFVLQHITYLYDYSKTNQCSTYTAYDIVNHRSAFIENSNDLSHIDINTLDWQTYGKELPGAQLLRYVESTVNKSPSQ